MFVKLLVVFIYVHVLFYFLFFVKPLLTTMLSYFLFLSASYGCICDTLKRPPDVDILMLELKQYLQTGNGFYPPCLWF